MLSTRGQKVIGSALGLFAIRDDSGAEYTAAKLAQQLGGRARPIPLGTEITEYLDPAKHADFIAAWRLAVQP